MFTRPLGRAVVFGGYGDDSRPCPIPYPIPESARLAEPIGFRAVGARPGVTAAWVFLRRIADKFYNRWKMPRLIVGIGTQYIGERDFAADGSFVTTEFVTAFVPLYPVRSLRVKEGTSSTDYHFFPGVFYSTSHTPYLVQCEGKVNLKQAIYVYSFVALYVVYLTALFALSIGGRADWLMSRSPIYTMKWALQFLVFLLPLVVPLLMRFSTRRHAWTPVMQCPCGSVLPYSTCCRRDTEAIRNKERHFYKTFT